MAQYGKNNYFDGVILPEPKEEMLRRMAKGVDASKGYFESTDAGLLFDGPRSMECFFNLRQSDGTQRPAQFSTSMLAIAVTPMDAIMFHCGNKSLQVSRATIGDDIHAVISYDGATAMCYINGIEVGAMQPTAYTPSALFRIGDPLHITKSPVHFCRHFNYALSAEEVAAHYNNGDPMGYVLPGTYKGEGNSYESNFSTSSERRTPLDGAVLTYDEINHVVELNSGNNRNANMYSPVTYDTRKAHVYNIEVIIDKNTAVSRCRFFPNTSYESIYLTAEDNDDITIFKGVYIPSDRYLFSNNLYCYFILSSPTTVRVRSIRVTPVGCIAEYLPQNLIPTAEGSVVQWLDSAPQPPEANGILPPLDASVGGYDLAAIGNPKIII